MGAIVAVLRRRLPPDSGVTRAMLAASPHRGSQYELRECGSALLGVSNQIDFADSSISHQGELMAAFSGKLDNAVDLIEHLAKAGYPPVSTDAADLTVSAFRAFGPDAPNRMRGIFAAVVTDGRRMWCFRDHVGLKPLYYRDEPQGFFAASEAKQIVVGAGLRREPDLDALERILFGKRTEEIPCALRGVNLVRQEVTYCVAIDAAPQRHCYWSPEKLLESSRFTPAQAGERFSELFDQAVARSLTGQDVVSLSGGVDSPAVAAFAAPQHLRLTGRPLSALSAVFPDQPKVDESRYIRLIVEYLGMNLHTYEIRATALDDVTRWCDLLDGPVPTILVPEIHENYALARQLGFRNILTGELAEYVIGMRAHVIGHLLVHGRLGALRRLLTNEIQRGASRKALLWGLVMPGVPGRIWNSYMHKQSRNQRKWIPDWINHRNVIDAPYRPDLLVPGHRRWSAQQLIAFKGAALLDPADELCAELSGVTVRRPFVDVDLWEFFLGLPAETKFPDLRSKTLVRSFLRGKLPDAILDRRDKTAFDDHLMAQVNYQTLRRWLLKPRQTVAGVDYRRLADRIERQDLNVFDWLWASTLIRVHAFLSLWEDQPSIA